MNGMKQKKILIAGGGIGGLALAKAFEKIGLDYVILEKAARISEIGAGITIWSNGTHCLKELGLKNEFEQKTSPLNEGIIQNHKGQILAVLDFSDFKERFGAGPMMIHRADLIDILQKDLPLEKIFLNSPVQSFEEDSKSIIVNLASGRRVRGDILIGADGIHSAVRKGLTGEKPKYAGYTCWRGLFTMDKSSSTEKTRCFLAMGPGSEFGFAQLNDRMGYWFAAVCCKTDSSKKLHLENLKQAFSDWPENIRNLIHRTPHDSIIRNDILELAPKKNRGRGRCALLGDSAHGATPHLAQGACMALEDAVILAHLLLKNSDREQALRIFEKKRYARVTAVIRESRFLGKISHLSHPFLTKARNLAYLSMNQRILHWRIKKYAAFIPPSLS